MAAVKYLSSEGLSTLVSQIKAKFATKDEAKYTGSEAIKVANNVVSLKIAETPGNVTLTQSEDGLKAAVEIAVKAVDSADKFLKLDSGVVKSDISLSYDSEAKEIKLLGKGVEVASIDATDFIKDGMLDSASFDSKTNELVLTFNQDSGKEDIRIPMASLVDTYTAKTGGGLILNDHEFSVDTDIIATVASVNAVKDTADAALTNVVKGTDGDYFTTSVSKTGTQVSVSGAVKVQAVSTASTTNKGLVEASDVKSYIDAEVKKASDAAADAKTAIDTAISTLDADVTSDDAAVASVKVVETDGKVSDVVVTNIAAGVAYAAATETAQANLTATTATGAVTGNDIKAIKSYIDTKSTVEAISSDEITALFA